MRNGCNIHTAYCFVINTALVLAGCIWTSACTASSTVQHRCLASTQQPQPSVKALWGENGEHGIFQRHFHLPTWKSEHGKKNKNSLSKGDFCAVRPASSKLERRLSTCSVLCLLLYVSVRLQSPAPLHLPLPLPLSRRVILLLLLLLLLLLTANTTRISKAKHG
ncbi:hypothetical protein V8C35DRAFT_301057 [Trichoderma chlorosporum]